MRWRLIAAIVTVLMAAACAAQEAAPARAPVPKPLPAVGSATAAPALLPPQGAPRFAGPEWATDFTRSLVAWEEIRSGGPPKDGIPAIDSPSYESISDAQEWLSAGDPVLVFEGASTARAYPLAILIWHEIVNDTIDGRPIAATFCPLCNASIVFDRTFGGQVLDFGTTGLLRNSDLVMYDRQSESWWQQATGQSIVGEHAGERLTFLAAQTMSFADFAALYPEGDVLARPGISRDYGRNPYTGYDGADRPFLFDGETDERLPALSRVIGVVEETPQGLLTVAWPLESVAAAEVLNEAVGDRPVVLLHQPGMRSALDTSAIRDGRDVGAVGVFDRRVDGQTLTFERDGDAFRDGETGSVWTLAGRAISGPLAGTQLERLVAFDHYWFAWSAFYPESEVRDVTQ
jgi:hypothetical protein